MNARAPRGATAQTKRVATPEAGTAVVANESQNVENPRPRRASMDGGFRDKLTVHNPDPNYQYRWAIDSGENGARIQWLREDGWEFAPNSGRLSIGERNASNANPGGDGGVARVPADSIGNYHYLMRIKKEWYDEDQKAKIDKVNQLDAQIHTSKYEQGEAMYNSQDNETRVQFGKT